MGQTHGFSEHDTDRREEGSLGRDRVDLVTTSVGWVGFSRTRILRSLPFDYLNLYPLEVT